MSTYVSFMHIHIKATLYSLPSLFAFQMTGWLRREGIVCFGDAAVIAFDIGINSSVRATWERKFTEDCTIKVGFREKGSSSDSGRYRVARGRAGVQAVNVHFKRRESSTGKSECESAILRASQPEDDLSAVSPWRRVMCYSLMWTAVPTKLCLHRSVW